MAEHDNEGVDLIEVHSLEEIPEFENEASAAAWWTTHELSEELWRRWGRPAEDKLAVVLPVHKGKRRAAPEHDELE